MTTFVGFPDWIMMLVMCTALTALWILQKLPPRRKQKRKN